MNKTLRSLVCLAAAFTAALLLLSWSVAPARAQAAADATAASAAIGSAALDTAGAVAQPFIVGFAEKHPWLVTALALIATLRLVFKPLMSAASAYVKSTPGTADDAMLDRVEHSTAFRVAAWLLDYLGSIKVGPQRAPSAPAPAAPRTP
ncbi:MAG: hypothetical protein HZC55_26540 [Verrucomicrobia bacterium]|nr:hypothetical protein [Verrucomicrobiota bacterium]